MSQRKSRQIYIDLLVSVGKPIHVPEVLIAGGAWSVILGVKYGFSVKIAHVLMQREQSTWRPKYLRGYAMLRNAASLSIFRIDQPMNYYQPALP